MAERSSVGIVIVLALLLIGLLFVLPMLGMSMMMGRGMMGGWGYPAGAGWGFMFAGMLIPFLFIVLLIVGAYFLLTRREQTGETERALSILNERYAKGEIAKEQYLEMKEHLAKKSFIS